MHAVLRATLLVLVPSIGCFADPPSTSTSDSASASSSSDTGTTTMATGGDPTTASTSITSAATGSVDVSSGPLDTSDTDPPPVCGAMGEPCCAGMGCVEGACLENRCVAFAGAYLDGELCDTCPTVLGAADCGCPEGFETTAPFPLLSAVCIEGTDMEDLPWIDEVVAFCQAPVYVPGRSDWAGVYLRAPDAGGACLGETECAVGNDYAAGACECPVGSSAIEVEVFRYCGGVVPVEPALPPAYRLGICLDDVAAPLTIADMFLEQSEQCLPSYPDGSTCMCPGDFDEQTLGVISQAQPNMGGDLRFCVRAP